ncbi:MAG: HipA N-terminal domain-containing protein [Polyangiaceae bacterium]
MVTILHLSDLHFGRKHRFEKEGLGTLLSRVVTDLAERADRDGLRPDLVVLSGDFAEYGKHEEFNQAATFVRGLAAHLSLPPRRFVIVPGNHDINWNKSRAYFEDREGDGLPPEEPYFRKFVHYKRFFDEFYEGEKGIEFTEQAPWTFFEMPDLRVVIAGLNSDFAESHRPEDHHAFLGERQIRAFAEKMRPYKERGFLRIGVLHHDPVDKRGGTKADQDQRDFRKWLVPELNLVLHGDIHEETLRYPARDVPAIGVGSAAVGVDERGPDISNEYQILVVREGGLDRYLRAWVSDQKRWIASPHADAQGESGKTFIRVDFESVHASGGRAEPSPGPDMAAIVASYRASVVRNEGAPTMFDLLGIGGGDGGGGLDFLKLFVPQNATRDRTRPERRPRLPVAEPIAEEDSFPFEDDYLDRDWMNGHQTVDKLFHHRRLLFIGAPGAGKTALTRWVLLKLCAPGERLSDLPDDTVPIRVELRRFDEAHRRSGAGYSVLDHVAREQADLHGPLTADRIEKLASEGRVLWLFDGLDEITDPSRRREMAIRMAGLTDQFPDCRAVVTSRIAGIEVGRPVLEGAGFQTHAIEDFTPEQRDHFLDTWHALVFRADPRTGAERRGGMARAIDEAPSLQELCKNPLLCAMLAFLHREHDLPRRRHLLYQKVIERMAEHWEANKGLPPRPLTEQFELEDKLAFLRSLAWKMQSALSTSGNIIGQGKLEDFATAFCERRWGQSPDTARRRAEALIQHLHERGGVLAYLGADRYGFAHRAFLEHLVAADLVARFRGRQCELSDLASVFGEHWHDPIWEETLLLLCGLLQDDGESGPQRVVSLLQSIGAGRVDVVQRQLSEYLIFCIKALGELPQLDTGVPGDFASSINEVLVCVLSSGAMWSPGFTGAFRRCSGRWPEVAALAKASEHWATTPLPEAALRAWESWIAAGGRAARVDLLCRALRQSGVHPTLIFSEAALHGAWSRDEISVVFTLSSDGPEQRRTSILLALALTRNVELQPEDDVVARLREYSHSGNLAIARVDCAWRLLMSNCHAEEAYNVLVSMASSSDHAAASHAALLLLNVSPEERWIEKCGELAQRSAPALVRLASFAKTDTRVRATVSKVVAATRGASDPENLLHLACETKRHGLPLFTENEILAAFERLPSFDHKLRRLPLLSSTAGLERAAAIVASQMLQSRPNSAFLIFLHLRRLDPSQAGSALLDLWAHLMAVGAPAVAIDVARRVLDCAPGGTVQQQALEVRDRALEHTTGENQRLWAATIFLDRTPQARLALEHLSRNAQSESIRFQAAELTGDLHTLHQLAGRATGEHIRNSARNALELHGEIRSLLQVGKLRRARVRLDGNDAGILEELTRVGNGTRFTYDADYTGPALAPNMPVDRRVYDSPDSLHPFFANLLPQGALYEQTARRLGLKRSDRFGVLLRVGADTMGAVEILPMEPA